MALTSRGRQGAALLLALASLGLQVFFAQPVLRLLCLMVGACALGLAWVWSKAEGEAAAPSAPADHSEVLLSAGHDLRQPVQAISLFAASLSAYPLPDATRKLVSGIEAGAQSLSGMLEAVFGLAKLSAGRLSCQNQVLILDDLLAHAVEDKFDIAEERELHLRHVFSSAEIQADPVLLRQALAGIVRHALDRAEGGILLGARRRGDNIWIELRYQRSEPNTLSVSEFQPAEGFCDSLPDKGYGLAHAQGLVELMGGRLELFARAGQGCLLRLRLPVA